LILIRDFVIPLFFSNYSHNDSSMTSRSWWLMMIFTRCAGDVQNYHSPDVKVIAQKNRLLAAADEYETPLNQMSIRAHFGNQTGTIPAARNLVNTVSQGGQNLLEGFQGFYPVFDGVKKQYSAALKAVDEYYSYLAGNKTVTDKMIESFTLNNEAAVKQLVDGIPGIQATTFKAYNQKISSMYSFLKRTVDGLTNSYNAQGQDTHSKQFASAIRNNKTLAGIKRALDQNDYQFRSATSGKIIPGLINAKFDLGGTVAQISKAGLDAKDKLNNELLPSVTESGELHMKIGGDNLISKAESVIATATKNIRGGTQKIRSILTSSTANDDKLFARNLTELSAALAASSKQVAEFRKTASDKMTETLQTGLKSGKVFQQDTLNTANDLASTISIGQVQLGSASQVGSLSNQAMETEYAAKISQMFPSNGATLGSNGRFSSIQQSISKSYAEGQRSSGDVLSSVQSRVSKSLSDEGEMSAVLSGQIGQVSDFARMAVGPNLDQQVGISNIGVATRGDELAAQIANSASNMRASLDSTQADREDDQASLVSQFQNSLGAKDQVLSQLGDLMTTMAAKHNALAGTSDSIRKEWVGAVEATKNSLGATNSDLASTASGLREIGGKYFPSIDADNEDRIKSAFNQLTQLRRLTTSSGDQFASNGTALVNAAMAQGRAGTSDYLKDISVDKLGDQLVAIRSGSGSLVANMSAFDADMNAQMADVRARFAAAQSIGGINGTLDQIAAQAQNEVMRVGRDLVKKIYNLSNANLASIVNTDPRLNIAQYLSYLTNQSKLDQTIKPVQDQVGKLSSVSATTAHGLKSFSNYLSSLKSQVNQKWAPVLNESNQVTNLEKQRQDALAEIVDAKSFLNNTMQSGFQTMNETVNNKTFNFYKQWQTAAIVADSLTQGFQDYIAKMIKFEQASAEQRAASQDTLIKSIRENVGSASVYSNITNATELARIQKLVRLASDATNTSQAAVAARDRANQDLIASVGVQAAAAMRAKYAGLSANADALASAIHASTDAYTSDRVGSLVGSQMGASGINEASGIFAADAGASLENQKKNAKLIDSEINDLFDKNGFLVNITATELSGILESVQNSDQLYRTQMNTYKSASDNQVATLGGTIADFATLASKNIEKTNDYLNELTRNLSSVITRSDAIVKAPINAVKADLGGIKTVADTTNHTLTSTLMSIDPLEDGVADRLASIKESENRFAENTQNQLNSIVNQIHKDQGDVSVARQGAMNKLRGALSQLMDDFRTKALEFQSQAVGGKSPSALIQSSEADIRHDMHRRIEKVKKFMQRR
jgi:hypothetical protein